MINNHKFILLLISSYEITLLYCCCGNVIIYKICHNEKVTISTLKSMRQQIVKYDYESLLNLLCTLNIRSFFSNNFEIVLTD